MFPHRRARDPRLQALRSVPFLADCSDDQLARIDGLGVTIRVAPGRVLTREGSPGRECFVTLSGVAVARRAGRPIGVIPPGSIIGEMALLDHATRNATVVADTAMQLLVLDRREFVAFLDTSPCVAGGVERITATRRAG